MPTTPPTRPAAAPAPTAATSLQRRQSLAALAIGACASVVVFAWSVSRETAYLRGDVERRAEALSSAIAQQLERRSELLIASASFLAVTRGSDRAGLRSFTGDLARHHPGTVLLDWAPRVAAADVKAHDEAQWLQGVPEFHVHRQGAPLPSSGDVFPLHSGLGGGARLDGVDLGLGSDLSAIDRFAPALAAAREGRGAVLAGTLRVFSPEGTRFAAVFVAPVHSVRGAAAAPEERGDFSGYALGLFEVEEAVRDALVGLDLSAVTIELRDAGADGPADPVFLSRAVRSEEPGLLAALSALVGATGVGVEREFELRGRRFRLETAAGERLVAEHRTWVPWLLLLAGLAASGFAAASASSSAKRGAGLVRLRRRLDSERRDYMERLGTVTEDLERERLDRRRTQESLFREKQQFRLMFNAVPAMIWYKDTKNRFLLVNEAAAAAMGRGVEEMEGRPCAEVVPSRAYELYRDDLEIIQTGKPLLGVIEQMQLPDGRTIWTRTDKLPEYDAMGRVVGILVFSQDITVQRKAEAEVRRLAEELEQRVSDRTAELKAANQELESFAYSVSHDLRTPLRSIDGFSKILLEEYGSTLPAQAGEYLRRLRGGAQRMGTLVDDLMRLTRVSRAEIARSDVDLSALARATVEELRRADPGRRVDVVVEATPFAKGDPALLAAVVENLVGNAWKFTARVPEPRIEFGSRTVDGDRTAYYVRDNGAGFDMVYADKLFRPFQRLHGPEEFEGSGIGLATVQMVIRRHGGQVWAEGAVGQGATFYFTIGS